MSFVTPVFVLAGFCFVFGLLSLMFGYKETALTKTLLVIFGVCFLFLSIFSVMVGVGFSIEYTNQSPCENVISSTNVTGNLTEYTYTDSCSARATPESIERLYQAYSYIVYAIALVSVLALMFLGLRKVVFEW